jgi:hypothetical protein
VPSNNPWKNEWNGHKWTEPNGRNLNVESGEPAAQYYWVRCAREFLALKSSGARLAVYAGAITFYQLSNEAADRWINERCPGARSAMDNEDRNRRIAEIPLSSGRDK